MAQTTSGLQIPELREFSYQEGDRRVAYRLSTGKVKTGMKPRGLFTRYHAQRLLAEGGYTLPKLRQSLNAALNDEEIASSLKENHIEWQLELILPSETETETPGGYVLLDTKGNPLPKSTETRVLLPIKVRPDIQCFDDNGNPLSPEDEPPIPIEEDEGRNIFVVEAYDIEGFQPGRKYFDPKDPGTWDPRTGFFNLKNFRPKGEHSAVFTSEQGLFAVQLVETNFVNCSIGYDAPGDMSAHTKFRAAKMAI